MTVDLWDLRLQSDSNPISPPQCHMVITALPCSTTFPCQQLHPPPPFDSLRYRHIACILPCLSLVSLPYRTYVLSKNKKCCPCCGHKKQLPAVLDPSLLPPTITCSHLRLPFDPSPFPLKSICEVHSMKSYMFCMFTCRAQEALRNSGINGHFGPIPFARVGSRNCDRLMAMLVER